MILLILLITSCQTTSIVRINNYDIVIENADFYKDLQCIDVLRDYAKQIEIMRLYILEIQYQIKKSDGKKVIVIDNRDK